MPESKMESAFLNDNSSVWTACTPCGQRYLGTSCVTDVFVIPRFPKSTSQGLSTVVLLFLPHSLGQVCLVLGTSTAQCWEWQQTCLSLCCNLPLLSPGSVPTAQYSCLFHTYLDISKATEPGGEQAPGRGSGWGGRIGHCALTYFFSFCLLSPRILQVGRSEPGLYFPFPCSWDFPFRRQEDRWRAFPSLHSIYSLGPNRCSK